MAGHWTADFSFVTGAIRGEDLAYLVLSNDEAAARKIPLSGFVQWEPTGWGDGGQVQWRTAGVAVVRTTLEQFCAVGEFGEVLLLGSGDRHFESIGSADDSPRDRGPLRGVRLIGDNVYVVGMDRQAYRRTARNRWDQIDDGAKPDSSEEATVGFESVDGFSEKDIYAVGWDGEIWSRDGVRWKRRDSPVNSVLVDVCCGGDGTVYACSRSGLLIAGREDAWDVVDLDGMSDDIWSLAWYQDRLFLSTMDNVFMLGSAGLQIVNMGRDRPKTCYDLATGAGMLWSIGAKDVMSFDGRRWVRID